MKYWLIAAVLAGSITLAVLMLWRDYSLQMALFTGLGVGALTFVTLQTIQRLRDEFGPQFPETSDSNEDPDA